ncbi:proline dehydrogenase [Purpureocillium takamizusanense]|uniref:Proline dehydrogenase n=1 Tax=Purpureocillium takamizusanense TaxID=2060973 RepID=A0A9Q8QRW1_9HYPO|nr:proline dehydrogenase [Purpureocillium takamizusanense]UNI23731.1 proline dehydrogenase [Purpureocillium takamizusanense]
MGRPWLLRPSLAALSFLCRSKSAFFNPDRNWALNKILRWVIYDQFAAGTNAAEVARKSQELKRMGFQGIILGYAREFVLEDPSDGNRSATGHHGEQGQGLGYQYSAAQYEVIDNWKKGTLETLRMIGAGDFLAIKLTGAGPVALDAMRAKQPMPEAVADAMTEICDEAIRQGSRIWVDAEQQVLQQGLDEWVMELMRRYNHRRRGGEALIYNTIQAYLKASQANACRHLQLAAEEGWTPGIKLVRGAYIENEVRSLIHDTKAETDRSYDAIVDMLLTQRWPPEMEETTAKAKAFPPVALFLATHNTESATRALATHRARVAAGLPTAKLECGQIQGMADELSCLLLENYERFVQGGHGGGYDGEGRQSIVTQQQQQQPAPGVMKCLSWGSVSECMGYLYRRAVENRGAVERTEPMLKALKQELRRRVFG